ncbi:hypothetical protein O181_056028 [Austropuccinia psidii MF-1]|uniref:Uncharacterized protein n=1 Tax=Austropuccinia psidii MF-1 TaxID=1389203 RepID=A0A9Q3ECC6_9BASI|nr:hypothetical protein [Austropuccinia psidii MF-1]
MSPVHFRYLGIPRNHPEARARLFRYRKSRFGQHGKSNNTEEHHAHTLIQLPIQQRPQTSVLERHGSSTSAPPTPQRPVPVEHGTQEVQSGLTLGRVRGKLSEEISQRYFFQRPYGNYQRLESKQEIQTPRREGSQNHPETSHNPGYRGAMEPERAYSCFIQAHKG